MEYMYIFHMSDVFSTTNNVKYKQQRWSQLFTDHILHSENATLNSKVSPVSLFLGLPVSETEELSSWNPQCAHSS